MTACNISLSILVSPFSPPQLYMARQSKFLVILQILRCHFYYVPILFLRNTVRKEFPSTLSCPICPQQFVFPILFLMCLIWRRLWFTNISESFQQTLLTLLFDNFFPWAVRSINKWYFFPLRKHFNHLCHSIAKKDPTSKLCSVDQSVTNQSRQVVDSSAWKSCCRLTRWWKLRYAV